MADPEAALARLSGALALAPPLANRYRSHASSRRGGGGDPLASGALDRIQASRGEAPPVEAPPLDLPHGQAERPDALYRRFVAVTSAEARPGGAS